MKCVEVKKQIDLAVDNQLSFEENKRISEHFADCFSCNYQYQKLLLTKNVLRNQPKLVPSQNMDSKILEAFKSHHQAANHKPQSIWQFLTLPKLSFAQALPIFLLGFISTFLLGKFAFAEKIETVKVIETPVVETKIVEKEVEKIVPQIITVTKNVKVPVLKTKIVTTQPTEVLAKNNLKRNVDERETKDIAANDSSFFSQIIQTNLTSDNFRPVSNIEIKIIKKGETHE